MSPALRDLLGILGSYVYVFGLIGIATLLMRRGVMDAHATRKVIHIGVAHWWLIAIALFDNPWIASIGPMSFIVINGIDIRLRLMRAMEEGADRRNWGTVYFPVSLLVLVNACWRGVMPMWVGGIGILVLGWGDGLAALVGEASSGKGVRLWGGRKSIAGTATMFGASFAVTLVFTLLFNARFSALLPAAGVAACVAAAATAVEVLTPLGIDNITVPLATSFLYAAVFL
jgi:phytol kinase